MGELWFLPVVVGVGGVCGFVNVMAGGGSFLALPVLIFFGLPPTVANGTNRVALLAQNLVAVRTFHRRGMVDWGAGRALVVPLLVGALIGASIAVSLDQRLMTLAIAISMTVMFVVMLWNPARLNNPAENEPSRRPGWIIQLVFLILGIYGGLIQAGSGVFMLFVLMASGHELLRASAIRLLLILCYTPLALGVFLYSGQVDWQVGLALAAGNVSGALVGIRVAVERGAGFARAVLLVVLAGCSCKLFYDALSGG